MLRLSWAVTTFLVTLMGSAFPKSKYMQPSKPQSYTSWPGCQTIASEFQIYMYAFEGRNQERVSYNLFLGAKAPLEMAMVSQ